MVSKLVGLCFVQISNSYISASVWHWAFKYWLRGCFIIKNSIFQSQKNWCPSWSNFVWIFCTFVLKGLIIIDIIIHWYVFAVEILLFLLKWWMIHWREQFAFVQFFFNKWVFSVWQKKWLLKVVLKCHS